MNEGTHAVEVLKQIDTAKNLPVPEPTDRYLSVIERLASDPNVDIEKLQKIIDMKNREEDRSAEQAYNSDMVLAQAEIRVAVKNKTNQQTQSDYADLGALIVSAKPIFTKHGFAPSFYPGPPPSPEYVRVMCDNMHRDGHSKTRFYDVPIDKTGIAGKVNKTQVHGEASSFSYGRRYLLAMIYNLPTGDDDGNAAGGAPPVEYITGKDLKRISDLVVELYDNPGDPKFWSFAGATKWEEIPLKNHDKILSMLNDRKVAMANKATKKTAPKREPGEEG